jgi:hypothetical protein
MNISGIGVMQAQLNQMQREQKTLERTLLEKSLPAQNAHEKESIHMEIELKDATTVSIDYVREGMTKKTSYELGRFGNYSYGDDLFSPENTAGRILDFARSLWDGSQDRLNLLAGAIEQGVKEARDILGALPDWLDGLIGRTEDLLHKGIEAMRSEIQQVA